MLANVPWASLLGGALLGLSAVLLLLFNGKVAGISGIIKGVMMPKAGDVLWRVLFLAGMLLGGLVSIEWFGVTKPTLQSSHLSGYIVAGLLVGIGTYIGNGCTSGHGICGIGRLSKRSMVATAIFMVVAGLTVFVRLHLV